MTELDMINEAISNIEKLQDAITCLQAEGLGFLSPDDNRKLNEAWVDFQRAWEKAHEARNILMHS